MSFQSCVVFIFITKVPSSLYLSPFPYYSTKSLSIIYSHMRFSKSRCSENSSSFWNVEDSHFIVLFFNSSRGRFFLLFSLLLYIHERTHMSSDQKFLYIVLQNTFGRTSRKYNASIFTLVLEDRKCPSIQKHHFSTFSLLNFQYCIPFNISPQIIFCPLWIYKKKIIG